ncbi:HNH endonuclease [Enteractinococcus coprophilus]|uniref:HNH endonuclease n=2 Tax=Enteractinococcus coprophilus TaxID=1027633 RepID=A0A543ANL9_9MICC|nr:HNH endonuclease [Enteractinococcus coprophilus]
MAVVMEGPGYGGNMTTIPTSQVEYVTEACDNIEAWDPAVDEAECIDRIRALAIGKSRFEAAMARETADLARRRAQAEADQGVVEADRGKGLGAEIGLARKESPSRGARHLNLARALTTDLPHTFDALREGRLSEEHAQAVVQETSWLSSEDRREVDVMLVDRFGTLGPRKLRAEARAHAQRLDAAGAVEHINRAVGSRRVGVRPAPNGMAYLTATLPTQQAVGVYSSLHRDASTMVGTGETEDRDGQPRTRDQIMADLLVERATGQQTAKAVPAEVQLVMTPETLCGWDDTPAWLSGHGPIPAPVVRQWLADETMVAFLRRVFTEPKTGQLVSLESTARAFPLGLRRKILLRDDICRTPYCEAPIKEVDHIHPVRQGGTTRWDNASGLCVACNQTKENRGWEHRGNGQFLRVTTPTGHHYTVATPELLPGRDIDPEPP